MPTAGDGMKGNREGYGRVRQPIGDAPPEQVGDAGGESKERG